MCDGCEVNQKYYKHNIEDPEKERRILDSLCIPTQTEIRSQLGSKLADVFFENLTSEARIFLGLQPPLVGPSDVWINPNSRLKKKVRCEPIPEPQVLHQKALMHQTILEIGTSHIDDLKNQLRQEVEEAVRNQAINYEEEFEKRMALEIERVKLEAEVQCKQVVGTLMLHFDKCFADVVERHKLKMRKECQVKVLEERADLAAHMMSELQREIEKRDLELCSDFHDTLNGELNALERKFVKQIDAERKIAEEVIEGIVEKYEQMLVNVRAEMEMANTIDLCQAIAQENALREKEVREEKASHEDIIIQLVQRNNALQKKNETLQKMATERSKRIENYQKKMKGLLEEFQKFVNYALEATPAHAEYLLSTQKMVLKKYHEDGLVDPEDYEDYQRCLAGLEKPFEPVCPPAPEKKKRGPCMKAPPKPEVKTTCRDEPPSKYAFDYDTFKYKLLKNLVKGIRFDGKDEEEEEVKQEEKLEPIEEVVEPEYLGEGADLEIQGYKDALTLVGENQKDHLQPVKTFLRSRASTMMHLCKNDPELVKTVLGCPPQKET